jgi:hypothetical protein
MQKRYAFIAAVLIVAGVLTLVTPADAGRTFTLIHCKTNEVNMPLDISMAKATQKAITFDVVGHFIHTSKNPNNKPWEDKYALADACWGAFVHHLKRDQTSELEFIRKEDAEKIKTEIAVMGEAGLKKLSEDQMKMATKKTQVTTSVALPQPFGPFTTDDFYLITIGDPAYIRDNSDRIVGIDPDKTKFACRFVDMIPIATFRGWQDDRGGYSKGEAVIDQYKGNPAYIVADQILYNMNNQPFLTDANGKQIITKKNLNDLMLYWNKREKRINPKKAIDSFTAGDNPDWKGGEEFSFYDIYFKFTDAALSSPISKAPDMLRKDVKTAAAMTPKDAVNSCA